MVSAIGLSSTRRSRDPLTCCLGTPSIRRSGTPLAYCSGAPVARCWGTSSPPINCSSMCVLRGGTFVLGGGAT